MNWFGVSRNLYVYEGIFGAVDVCAPYFLVGKFGGRKLGEMWGGDRDFLSLFVTISLWCGGVMYNAEYCRFCARLVWYGT